MPTINSETLKRKSRGLCVQPKDAWRPYLPLETKKHKRCILLYELLKLLQSKSYHKQGVHKNNRFGKNICDKMFKC